jgi:hypothetical protein
MAHFTATPLVSGGYMVEGTDATGVSGVTKLTSPAWDKYLEVAAHEAASAVFDEAVSAFVQPLVEAAEEAAALAAKPGQGWDQIVLSEAEPGRPGLALDLDEDGVLLYVIHSEEYDILRWIGGSLVAVAV